MPQTADLDISRLSLLQRILVTTDGTLTDILAAAFLEPIQLIKLAVTIERSAEPVRSLDVVAESTVMRRRVVLRGERISRELRVCGDSRSLPTGSLHDSARSF